jgi:DNA repair exonuclease SbcCD nuclease subunit
MIKTTEFIYDDHFNETSGKLSVLTIGDPHFRVDNLDDISIYINRVEQLVISESPDFVVVLGDLLHCHERLHTNVLNKAYTFLNRLRKHSHIYVLVGNHDYINNSQFLTTNHWMNALKEWENITIVDTGHVLLTPQGKFIFCPYVFPGRFQEALTQIDSDWKKARAIFCHQEFFGCKMGALTSVEGDVWDCKPFILSGHIHDKQRVKDTIFYTGSSLQHAFGESHDKTVSFCHFAETLHVESVDLGLPRKKILYMDIAQIQTYQPVPDTSDKIRITLSGTYEDFKVFRKSKQYKRLTEKNNVKIVYRHPKVDETSPEGEKVGRDDFYDILWELVMSEKNQLLRDLYTELIHPYREG